MKLECFIIIMYVPSFGKLPFILGQIKNVDIITINFTFGSETVHRILRRDFEACRNNGCPFDITLKYV